MTRPPKLPYYLDHAAATPLDPAVFEAMKPHLTDLFANPSSLYMAARVTRLAIDDARSNIAHVLGAKPTEIVFTSGGTESNNLAIQGVLRARPLSHWVTTTIEHDAVRQLASNLSSDNHACTIVPVAASGQVLPDQVRLAIRPDTVLVSVMMANNEIGTIQPVQDIAKIIAAVRQERLKSGNQMPIYLHTDAVQAAGYLDLHVTRVGVDLLSVSGSKIYGPKGTGFLYVRHTVRLGPLQYGGGQERGRRSGTENVAGIVGLACALKLVADSRTDESRRLLTLRDDLIRRLATTIPDALLNGDQKRRLPNNVNLTIPQVDGETLILYLDKLGVQASTGSACSTTSVDPSHVLLAIGRSQSEATSSLRLTMGRQTDAKTIDYLSQALPEVVARLRTPRLIQ